MLMMGDTETADRLIAEAQELVDIDTRDLTFMQLYSAWLKKDTQQIHGYLGRLAQIDIDLAQATAYRLFIDTSGYDPPLGPASEERRNWIDGYA